MKLMNKEDFLRRSSESLGEIYDVMMRLPVIELNDLKGEHTVLAIVDMINGFCREGALKSPRVEDIIREITELSISCDSYGIKKLAFADCHTGDSPEFDSYPRHCLEGTYEGAIVDEIREAGGYILISKNSTNGFLENEFQEWLIEHPKIETFIITGDCTDICIQQFAITLKTWFNMQNKRSRIIIPINSVETYDIGLHDGELVNMMALYNMMINGVEIVKEISII